MSAPRPNSCTSKRSFSCRWAAEEAVHSAQEEARAGRRTRSHQAPIAVYRCPRCSSWHVSSRTAEQVAAERAAAIAGGRHYYYAPDGTVRPKFLEVARA